VDRRRRIHAGHNVGATVGVAVEQAMYNRSAGDALTALDAQPKQHFDHRP
jgi:hypothetical protein